MIVAPVRQIGLDDVEVEALSKLLNVWREKRPKNLILNAYYDSQRVFRDLGISIPPQLQKTNAALGWPSRAVKALARKHQFEGFSIDGQTDPFDVGELLTLNEFETELSQAVVAAYKHSCSFITVTQGDTTAGEPDVLVQVRDAEWSAALWDKRRREISAALAIIDIDETGTPVKATLFLRDRNVDLYQEHGMWRGEATMHNLNRVLVEPLVYDPQIGRPFGKSRITREVRYLTDVGVRTMVRAEVGAEFFTSPQRYALGVKEDAFKDSARWTAFMGRVWALDLNEEGEKPEVGQFSAMSMAPHLEMYRQVAQNFCSETGLPTSAVGIFADNPASSEAMQAAENQLAEDAEYQWRIFRPRLRRVVENIIMLRDGLSEPPAEAWKMQVNWTPARYVSPQAASDFAVKAVGADPALGGTNVMRRRLGFSQGEIDELTSEATKARTAGVLERLLASSPAAPGEPVGGSTAIEDAQVLKAKFEALDMAVRAGVDGADAAARLGLAGIKLTGAVPVSLRQSEAEARGLEDK